MKKIVSISGTSRPDNFTSLALAIVNVSGQVLWKQEYNHPGGTLEEQANLAPWPSGTYFLRIEQPGTVQTRTFIKQR